MEIISMLVDIVLIYTLFYPIIMSVIWIIGGVLYSRKRKKRFKKLGDVVLTKRSFTVIIPVYNEAERIEELLSKNLKNKYENLLFWVINDCSTDNTKKVLDSMEYNKRLKITHLEKNRGKAGVLNFALEHITDDYFICVDSDTLIYPDAFEVLNKEIEFEDCERVAAYTGSITINQEEMSNRLLKIQKLEYRSIISMIKRSQDYFLKNILTVSGAFVCYKTETIKSIGGFDETNATEDIEITWRLTTNDYRAKYVENFVAEIYTPNNTNSLLNQRIRWSLGGIQTTQKYWKMIGKRGHLANKLFIVETFFSYIWLFSFIFASTYIILKVLFGYPERAELGSYILPTVSLLLVGVCLQTIAYKLEKGCKEHVDEFMSLVLLYPLVYWMIQPISYVFALFRHIFKKEESGKWRTPTRKNIAIRRVVAAIFDVFIFYMIYHIVRLVLFDTLKRYFPDDLGIIYAFLMLFWMIIVVVFIMLFISPKHSTFGESLAGIETSRERSFLYNITSPVALSIVINTSVAIQLTIGFFISGTAESIIATVGARVSVGGLIISQFYIVFILMLIERYICIIGRIWRNPTKLS